MSTEIKKNLNNTESLKENEKKMKEELKKQEKELKELHNKYYRNSGVHRI
nr:hypothetical protein [uncultured Cetobacterium sp.]